MKIDLNLLVEKYNELFEEAKTFEEKMRCLVIVSELKNEQSILRQTIDDFTMDDEQLKNYIVNNFSVGEVFDYDDIYQCVADEEDNEKLLDTIDRDTIVEWIKDNYDIEDLIDVDMRWN